MELKAVTDGRFEKVYKKMAAAFPYDERRDPEDERACFMKPEFRLSEIFEGKTELGFVAFWLFPEFLFLEHIAIDPDKRSGGYGTRALRLLQGAYAGPVVLEVEPPEDETKISRIRFYERAGFSLNMYEYFQPSYHGTEPVKLMIMSSPKPLSEEAYASFLEATRKTVYNII